MPVAMVPPAPARLSTTTAWPKSSASRAPTKRATRSTDPPGANGTSMRTGRVGYVCENAVLATASPTANRKLRELITRKLCLVERDAETRTRRQGDRSAGEIELLGG